MTSEKHMHNMMLLQQNMSQIQHNRHLGLGSLPSPAEAELYQYYLAQNMNLPNLKMDSTSSDAQFMMGGFQLDPTNPMAAMAPSLGEIEGFSTVPVCKGRVVFVPRALFCLCNSR